ncbi:uncharacterized protein LOC114480698 [Gouania willdenowi]|uniref:uncharacterized protein LOC114480698 n=1 Tax=Gouania willdenowi TaxID=441366 RepID=UPI00105603CB|nr:uncharacterized protein LOC114480698 [Gouania willdenowi]XP_028330883.1 uncharacterized protein LOC114480698 [Gouania willdenowi]
MVRLGVHPDTTSTVWMKPVKFDYSDFTFSPPSISVSLREERLVVQVHFPCAANRRCSTKLCCPISQLIDPWTTVTMNSDVNMTSQQSRTVWTHDVVSYVEFSGLSPGQNYCVVANFSFPTFSMAASPKSDPQCIRTTDANQSELQSQLLLGIGSTFLFLFLFLFLVVFLLKQRSKTTKSRSAPVPVPLPPSLVPVPVDPEDVHLELTEDDHQITVLLF